MRDIKSWEVWRRPEFGLDLIGKEELRRKIPRNFVLQGLPAISTQYELEVQNEGQGGYLVFLW